MDSFFAGALKPPKLDFGGDGGVLGLEVLVLLDFESEGAETATPLANTSASPAIRTDRERRPRGLIIQISLRLAVPPIDLSLGRNFWN